MSNKVKATSVKGVQALLKDGERGQYGAGGGLYLQVNSANNGSWLYRYKLEGKTSRMGLGSADAVTLADAREKAAEQRALIAKGIDPLANKQEKERLKNANSITFDIVAADYIATHREGWTNKKHAQQWENTLATYASPVIGHLQPSDITTEHILEVLTPIWNTKAETASRVRNRIELILNAAKARKLRTGENVAAWRGHLELLLNKEHNKRRKHHPALPWQQIGEFWQSLRGNADVGTQALKLIILSGVRTSEVLGAHWREFDLAKAIWTIPAERMKAGADHRVPLSTTALKELEAIPRVASGLLFEGAKVNKPASNMVMLMKIRRMHTAKLDADNIGWVDKHGRTIVAHGFRSTFRDWAAENTGFANIVVEQALAHTIGSAVEAAYRRGDLLERRRELMEAWGGYVTQQQASNVVSFHREA